MDPESKKLLESTFQLAEENNKMLRSMRRSMRIARVISALYWVLIIGSAVGAYYFVQPYIDQMLGVYGSTKSNIEGINTLLNSLK
ncbi:hypothetical protein K8Q98_02770 [Candidatus Nomurabacteria bacterium]|nr:hypothetical protein [Candidatus Nomurabacteria bacterium]